ncbi:hypothetical protein TD95_000264 [Thielaviopsis punctulata]|uniref:Programmed cell death protein 2 C-terminal domain-containing protein n=1 Tax=Thielaviopsis punctulata TaxID=72032 RepID=A0A0F4ZE23_9PEZI|nr:hypothetical protein TD95_000264 [Thielaviopsis punctulata]
MGGYDSESDIDQDFTETDVLLGYAQKEAGADTITHLGGIPEWIDAAQPPSAALARCKVCKDMMVLLLQLDAHLPDRFAGHDRRLFIFVCRRTQCRRKPGSIRALRSVRVAKDAPPVVDALAKPDDKKPVETNKVVTSTGLGESLFGAKGLGGGAAAGNPFGANPFAKPGAGAAPVNPFAKKQEETAQKGPAPVDQDKIKKAAEALPATFAEKLALNNPVAEKPRAAPTPAEPWPTTLPKAYPTLYMDAEYETLDPTPEMKLPAHAKIEKMEIEEAGPSSGSGSKEDQSAFESVMDATFQRFADRMAQNPEQVIRYEFAGTPLLYSADDAVGKLFASGEDGEEKGRGMPRCDECGAPRTFEVQITPYAITELEADEMSLDGMDWGTIIVGVCTKDCQAYGVEAEKVGYVEEWAGVQWEQLDEGK